MHYEVKKRPRQISATELLPVVFLQIICSRSPLWLSSPTWHNSACPSVWICSSTEAWKKKRRNKQVVFAEWPLNRQHGQQHMSSCSSLCVTWLGYSGHSSKEYNTPYTSILYIFMFICIYTHTRIQRVAKMYTQRFKRCYIYMYYTYRSMYYVPKLNWITVIWIIFFPFLKSVYIFWHPLCMYTWVNTRGRPKFSIFPAKCTVDVLNSLKQDKNIGAFDRQVLPCHPGGPC